MGERTEISIAPSRSASIATLKAEACRSQALYLFVSCSNFLVELADLCVFWRIVAAQLVEYFADGKLIYFSHRHLLCAALAGSALLGPPARRNRARAWASGCFLHDSESLSLQFANYDVGQMRAFLWLNPVGASPIRFVFSWITDKGRANGGLNHIFRIIRHRHLTLNTERDNLPSRSL